MRTLIIILLTLLTLALGVFGTLWWTEIQESSDLRSELIQSQSDLEVSGEQLATLQSELDSLNSELDEFGLETAPVQKELSVALSREQELNESLRQAQDELKTAQESIQQVSNTNDILVQLGPNE